MKNIISFILLSLLTANIFAITGIESISNDELRFEYDIYGGPLTSYENKLIASNNTRLNEYIMHLNGELERISSIELGGNSGRGLLSDNQWLIVPTIKTNPLTGFYIYDISQTPMEQTAFVDTYMLYPLPERGNAILDDGFLMIYDRWSNEIYLFDLITGSYIGAIPGFGYNVSYIEKAGDVFIQLREISGVLTLYLYSMINNTLVEIYSNSLIGLGSSIRQVSVIENKIVIASDSYLGIIDITNPTNPSYQYTYISNLSSFYYTDTHIYGFNNQYNFVVYQRDSYGNYSLIHSQRIRGQLYLGGNEPHSIQYNEPYVYVSLDMATHVFDSSNDYEIVSRTGRGVYMPVTSVGEDDAYYMEVDCYAAQQNIYSIIDNTLIASLNYTFLTDEVPTPTFPYFYMDFKIIGDRLYVHPRIDYTHYLDIYQLDEQSATLLNSIHIPNAFDVSNFEIIGDKVFFQNFNTPRETLVYNLINDNITFLGTFPGHLQNQGSEQPTDYLYILDAPWLIIRSVNNPLSFISSNTIPLSDPLLIYYLSDNYIVITNYHDSVGTASVYHVNINNANLTLIGTLPSDQITTKNGIITMYRRNYYNISEFYNIQNNTLTQIGSMNYGIRANEPSFTYFFPERNKKVFRSLGGIWVYDVVFEGEVSEKEEGVTLKTGLLGNYPNPFNPATNIKFSLVHESNLRIDIYNIKGQKILTLVEDFYQAGEHSIVWNGTDDRGYSVSSGVYLYKMEMDGVREIRRMVMMK